VSRIGRKPIPIPANVNISREGNRVKVVGPRGELEREFHTNMTIEYEDHVITVSRPDDARDNKALHGLTRALLANMVIGVTEGFRKRLDINGVGYRADLQGEAVVMQVGFSHPVRIVPPQGIKLGIDQGGHSIVVEGNDKELVGEVAAKIRDVRKPEPYKGKGITYQGEVVRRKAGKAGGR
jgi:large subunit ribosomal protein L6